MYISWPASLGNDQKTKDTMQKQLQGLAVTFCDKGIPKPVPQHDKCLNLHCSRCSSSFIQVPTRCNKQIFYEFLKHSLHPSSSYLLDMLHKYISLKSNTKSTVKFEIKNLNKRCHLEQLDIFIR